MSEMYLSDKKNSKCYTKKYLNVNPLKPIIYVDETQISLMTQILEASLEVKDHKLKELKYKLKKGNESVL